jgi:hypothetical protein
MGHDDKKTVTGRSRDDNGTVTGQNQKFNSKSGFAFISSKMVLKQKNFLKTKFCLNFFVNKKILYALPKRTELCVLM